MNKLLILLISWILCPTLTEAQDQVWFQDNFSFDALEKSSRQPLRTQGMSGGKLERLADSIVSGKLHILPIFEKVEYDIENINWKMDPFQSNSWQLYFHNLLMVGILNNAFEETNNLEYHESAKIIINQWIAEHPADTISTSNYTWYDHSVAFRSMHFVQAIENELSLEKPDYLFLKSVFESLVVHAKWMNNDKYYNNYNHSLFMDRALIQIAVFYPFIENSSEWKKKGLKRSSEDFFSNITIDGIVKEHSITYHNLVYNLYKKIFGLVEGEMPLKVSLMMDRMLDVFKYSVQPNGYFPMWGDSHHEHISFVKPIKEDLELEFISSKGKNGVAPRNESFIFKDGGIASFRTSYNEGEWENASHINFFAQYHSRVHKHSDDLSFTYYSLGEEILIDPGYWGYDNSETRKYLQTSLAHNTLSINNESYSTEIKDWKYVKISDWKLSTKVDYVKAEHNLYGDSLKIERALHFIKPNLIIILDNVDNTSLKKINITQNFNFTDKLNFTHFENTSFEGQIDSKENDSIIVSLKQHINSVDMLATLENDEKPYGIASFRNFTTTPIKQIKYSVASDKMLTSIFTKSEEFVDPVTNYEINSVNGKYIATYIKDGIKHQLILE